MYINAHDILGQDEGATARFEIADERPKLQDVNLAGGLDGQISLTRLDFGLLANGVLTGSLTLDCHRCLKSYEQSVSVQINGEFSDRPLADQWPIEQDGQIDLAPLARQELILATPIKTVCRPDCPGLCDICGRPQESRHEHTDQPRPANIRIVKGKIR